MVAGMDTNELVFFDVVHEDEDGSEEPRTVQHVAYVNMKPHFTPAEFAYRDKLFDAVMGDEVNGAHISLTAI